MQASKYNNAIIEGNWSISLPRDGKGTPSLWHYCPKAKIIRTYNAAEVRRYDPFFLETGHLNMNPRKALCIDCKEEPSEAFIKTYILMLP